MANPGVPSLPTELFESIIEALSEDEMTVKSCALVHWSWTVRCQEILFRKITLTTDHHWNRFINVLRNNTSIRAYVHTLELAVSRPSRLSGDTIRELLFHVSELRLLNIYADLVLIHNLPDIHILQLYWCNELRGEDELPESPDSLQLRQLDLIQDVSFNDVCDWLDRSRVKTELQIFSLYISGDGDFGRVVSFINARPSLVNVSLRFSIWTEYSRLKEYLSCVKMPSLQILNMEDCGGNEEVVPVVFDILRSNELPNLRHLSLRFITLGLPEPFELLTSPHMHDLTEWTLPARLASQMESIDVVFESIHEVADSERFFSLFGSANRPEVLRVRHANISVD